MKMDKPKIKEAIEKIILEYCDDAEDGFKFALFNDLVDPQDCANEIVEYILSLQEGVKE